MITDEKAAKKLAKWVEHLEESHVETELMNAGCLGLRGLAEQNPVALYLARKVGRRIHVGPGPDWWAHALLVPPERDVVASQQLTGDVRQFMEQFNDGQLTRCEAGPVPLVKTPWGRTDAIFNVVQGKVYYVRGEGDEGVACRWPGSRLMISDAAAVYATMCDGWACWGADAWPVVAHDLYGALPIILQHAPIDPGALQLPERALAYALNVCRPGRSFMMATACELLWPDDAVATFQGRAGGLICVHTVDGGHALITMASLRMAVAGGKYPLRLADLERVGDD